MDDIIKMLKQYSFWDRNLFQQLDQLAHIFNETIIAVEKDSNVKIKFRIISSDDAFVQRTNSDFIICIGSEWFKMFNDRVFMKDTDNILKFLEEFSKVLSVNNNKYFYLITIYFTCLYYILSHELSHIGRGHFSSFDQIKQKEDEADKCSGFMLFNMHNYIKEVSSTTYGMNRDIAGAFAANLILVSCMYGLYAMKQEKGESNPAMYSPVAERCFNSLEQLVGEIVKMYPSTEVAYKNLIIFVNRFAFIFKYADLREIMFKSVGLDAKDYPLSD
ncbi:hypothetical protein LJC46_07970 [Desulfovibrio sp. OttesenSCG-928-G15]|nr:hypothetical protein [Desulfovibrio sp. OttesenSCG-928-G15]